MLAELTIKNLAIIDEQVIHFSKGFNVISGETGSGKSLMLQALGFILNEKLSATAIRKGAEELEVSALFDLTDAPEELLQELPDIARVRELVVTRILPREGRGRVFINGRAGSLSLIEEIVGKLISIAGQHQSTRLLKPQYHLDLLDEYADLSGQVSEFGARFRKLTELKNALDAWKRNSEDSKRKNDLLAEFVEEVSKVEPRPGLRFELENSIKDLSGRERGAELAGRVLASIRSDDSPVTALAALHAELAQLERVTGNKLGALGILESAQNALGELESRIERYVSKIDFDDEALEAARGRLSELARLERKYKMSDQGLIEKYQNAVNQLDFLTDDKKGAQLQKDIEALESELIKEAAEISGMRKEAAVQLSKATKRDFNELAMKGAEIVVEVRDRDLASTGADSIRFLIRTHPSGDALPLDQVASGGELSRVTLILKRLFREKKGVPVLVFDEVDTGVSGGVARAVGKMIKDVASHAQVLCVTHLPQVASLADTHLLVSKDQSKGGRTVIEKLAYQERVDEVARMISGFTVTEAAKTSALELFKMN